MSQVPPKPKQNKTLGHASKRQNNAASTSRIAVESAAAAAPPVLSKTRICIKNIPSKLSHEKDLRQYIIQRLLSSQRANGGQSHQEQQQQQDNNITITDCRIIQPSGNDKTSKKGSNNKTSHCIAFVGFSSSNHAQLAIQQLHRTYYQTTKLQVEMAILPSSSSSVNTTKSGNDTTTSNEPASIMEKTATATTSVATSTVASPMDRKKQAFLAAMGIIATEESDHRSMNGMMDNNNASSQVVVPISRQFWSNDDTDMITTTAAAAVVDDQAGSDTEDDSDNDESADDDDGDDDDADPLHHKVEIPPLPSTSSNAAMDFLRSKQVNLSDLPVEDPVHLDNLTGSDSCATPTMMMMNNNGHSGEPATDAVMAVGNDIDEDNDETSLDDANDNIDPNRLFLRNLPFTVTEDELRQHFQQYGTIVECYIAIDDQYRNKGYAFLSFNNAASAYTARLACDQHDFHGRLLHILPAQKNSRTATNRTTGNAADDQLNTYKDSKENQRRANAMDDQTGWMSTHVRDDAVLDNLAVRLGIRKGDLFNVKDTLRSGDAAVRLALGETAIINENRDFFRQYGIDMETLVSYQPPPPRDGSSSSSNQEMPKGTKIERSTVSILVKNLPFDTKYDELKQIFIGNDVTILLPPSRTIAVVEYRHPNDAKLAFRKLAYRRFKNVPLYLEWAPLAAKTTTTTTATIDASSTNNNEVTPPVSVNAKVTDGCDDEPIMHGPTGTLYVKNLNFATTEGQLRDFFLRYDSNVRTVRIPKKVVTVKRDRIQSGNLVEDAKQLSMGFGFVEFSSKESAQAVLKKAQGAVLDDHSLELQISASGSTDRPLKQSASAAHGNDNKKLIVRNVPFQATRKELLQLFGSFGTLKKVRLPKKFDGSHRGFAFVEYLTAKESLHAMNTLSKTHLYGRHLVLEWAEKDEVVDDLDFLRSKAERDVMTSAAMAQPRNKKIRFD